MRIKNFKGYIFENKQLDESVENSEMSEDDLDDILNNYVSVSLTLKDLLSDVDFLIRTKNGKIYEFEKGELQISWDSDNEFKEQTGASLDKEYKGSKSNDLIDFIESNIDDDKINNIEGIYFEGEPGQLISKVFGQNKTIR